MRLGGRPGDRSRGRNSQSAWAGDQRESQVVGRKVGIRGGGVVGVERQFVEVGVWRQGQDRRDVYFAHRDGEGVGGAELLGVHGVRVEVGDHHRDCVGKGSLIFRGRPGDRAGVGVDGHAGWRRKQREEKRIDRNVGVGRRGVDIEERGEFVNRLIAWHDEGWDDIDFIDRDVECFGIVEGREAVVRHADRDWINPRAIGFAGRPGERTRGGVDADAGRRSGIKAESQLIIWEFEVSRGRGERESVAFVDHARADGTEDGRVVARNYLKAVGQVRAHAAAKDEQVRVGSQGSNLEVLAEGEM